MNSFQTFSLTILSFSLSFSFTAQELKGNEANNKITGATRIRISSDYSSVAFAQFGSSNSYDTSNLELLNRSLFGTRSEDSWTRIRSEEDNIGMVHSRFQQVYKGLEVDGSVYLFHSKNGKITAVNGTFYPNIELDITPSITKEQAISNALNHLQLSGQPQIAHTDETALVIATINKSHVLSYKCAIHSRTPLINKWVYVDAQTGKIIREINKMCNADVPGVGHTQFSGTQTITADQVSPTQFLLQESGRGNGIVTINSDTGSPYVDNNNDWNNVNATLDEFATDVHFGAEATYDFFFNNFGRDSYDGAGGIITSYVNDVSVGVNAYWSGGPANEMHYGNGDATDYFPVASLEVAGHELAHGVTEYSAGLIYADESGALNESFSDIFGNTIRFLNAPSFATWYIGDQILRPGSSGGPFRNMANPNEFENADTYGGLFFNNGDIVHYDSGIQNFWYYLLTEGGTGTNDNSDLYAVTAIGMNDAMQIAYRNLAFYLTPNSTFMDSRDGSEQAAIDLFGLCSIQHNETIHAWFAVGVGPAENGAQVVADYSISPNFSCTAPLNATFTPTSSSYEAYFWDFGDGTTSTGIAPSHSYSTNGSFTVTLTVTNTLNCPGSDVLVTTNAVVINPIDPIAGFTTDAAYVAGSASNFMDTSLYAPFSWSWNFGDGATSTFQNPTHTFSATGFYDVELIVENCAGFDTTIVQIEVIDYILMCTTTFTDKPSGVIYDSGNSTGNYQDNESCSLLIQPCGASSITLNALEMDIEAGYDYIYVYDGIDATGIPLYTYNGNDLGTPLTATSGSMFIQFESDFTVIGAGFKLSYTSTLTSNPPSADFIVSTTTPQIGDPVLFQDISVINPIAWSWDFGDGVGTSTLQNPSYSYSALGTYTVELIVTNCLGLMDTISYEIEVVDYITMCSISSTDKPTDIIYDSGGSSNNYNDNENCGLLIQPCGAQSITIEALEMDIESGWDYLYIYDGTNAAGTLLYTYNGNDISVPLTASSGSMFLRFTSDASVTNPGFKLSYTSVISSAVPIANFTSSNSNPDEGEVVNFTDLSSNSPSSWLWSFGDGVTSTLQNPSHVYLTDGTYTVTLIVTSCLGSDTHTITYTVNNTTGIEEIGSTQTQISVFPNPFQGQFTVMPTTEKDVKNLTLKLFDVSGREVLTQSESLLTKTGIVVQAEDLTVGQYILEIQFENETGNRFIQREKLQVNR